MSTSKPAAGAMRVVVVEDHTLLRQSLVKTVNSEEGFEVVGEASRGDEALEKIKALQPDLVMLDIGIAGGSGLEVGAQLRKILPDTRIVFLTMYEDDVSVSRAIELGADAYVLKTASMEEFVTALHSVREGSSYLSPAVARRVIGIASRPQGTTLTTRELEILRLLASGERPADVGARLFLSLKTVKNHLTSIYAKLGVETGTQAVAEAYRRGLVNPVAPPQEPER